MKLRNLSRALIMAVFAMSLSSCVLFVDDDPHPVYYYYDYYPAVNVYFDPHLHIYYYRHHGRWVRARRLPRHYRLRRHRRHYLRMRHKQPYRYHSRWRDYRYHGPRRHRR